MKNKMPVVGKRYRKKSDLNLPHCNIECVGFQRSFKEFYAFRFYNEENPNRIDMFSLNYFLENYEELPDSNPQEVNEVDRALEQLKEELKYFKSFMNGTSTTLTRSSQDLVDAIEVEKKSNELDRLIRGVNEVDRASNLLRLAIGSAEARAMVGETGIVDKVLTRAQNLINALEAEKNMSKPEPKIDIKEERVKPESIKRESIWKSFSDDFLYNSGFTPEQILVFEVIFNSFEQMQKDIEELKKNNQ